MAVDGLAVEEPAQQRQPVVEHVGATEDVTGGDERLGERGVGVGQPGFGPRPVRLGRQRSDRRDRVGEQVAGAVVAGVVRRDLGGAERGERHRPPVRRTLLDPVVEVRHGARAHPVLGCTTRCGAERPHAATPAVLDAVATLPAAVRGAPIAGSAGRALRLPRGIGTRFDRARVPPGCDRARGRRRSATAPRRRCSSRVRGRGSAWSACSNIPMSSLIDNTWPNDGSVTTPPIARAATRRSAELGVAAGHGGPRQARRQSPGLGRHRRCQLGIGQDRSDRAAERDRVALRHDDARHRSPAVRRRAGTPSTRPVVRPPPRRPAPRT